MIVGDIEIDTERSTVVEATELKKNPENKKTGPPKGFFEVIEFDEDNEFHNFSLTLQNSINFEECGYEIDSIDELKKITSDFYYNRFEEEYKNFYANKEKLRNGEIKRIKKSLEKARNNGKGILRIGHFSHAESMTMDTFRNIQEKEIKALGKRVHGSTRTLADRSAPFGWVIWE